jgi:hypothetical protein
VSVYIKGDSDRISFFMIGHVSSMESIYLVTSSVV